MKIKNGIKINKKGITPLIATVLLIGFTVALAGIVITWGGGFVERIQSGTDERTAQTLASISDLRLEIEKVTCPDTISIENKGNLRIERSLLRFFNSDGEFIGDNSVDGIDKYELRTFVLNPAIPSGTTKVQIIATLIVEGQEVTCGDSSKEKTFSPAC